MANPVARSPKKPGDRIADAASREPAKVPAKPTARPKARPCVETFLLDNFGPTGNPTFTRVCLAPETYRRDLADANTARWNQMPRHLYDPSVGPSSDHAGSKSASPLSRDAAKTQALALMAERRSLRTKAATLDNPSDELEKRLGVINDQELPRLARIAAGVEPEYLELQAKIITATEAAEGALIALSKFPTNQRSAAKQSAEAVNETAAEVLYRLHDRADELQRLANAMIPGLED